jgi:hydroxyacylglutathione hydrolase
MISIETFTFNAFQENCSVVYTPSKQAIIIDPGCYDRIEQNALLDFIASNELTVLALLNTHCHLDHIFGNAFCVSHFGVDLYAHREELFTLSLAERSAEMYGFPGFVPSPSPTCFVEDGDVLAFGDIQLKVIFGPGHAVGHVAFYHEPSAQLIAGDILFKGSFGRTDLPGGDMAVLKDTIFNRMFTLPDDTIVYPGHGPTTTIGEEKRSNYILQF